MILVNRAAITVLGVVVIATICGRSLGRAESNGARLGDRNRIAVNATPVAVRPLHGSVRATGTLEPWRRVVVGSPVSGVVAKLQNESDLHDHAIHDRHLVDKHQLTIGQLVAADAVLVEVDSTDLLLELDVAKSRHNQTIAERAKLMAGVRVEDRRRLESAFEAARVRCYKARRDFERMKRLQATDSVSEDDFQRSQAEALVRISELASAKADLEKAQRGATDEELAVINARLKSDDAAIRAIEHKIKLCKIRSPERGVLTELHVQTGERLAVDDPVFEIMDARRVIAVVQLDAHYIGRIEPAARASVKVPGLLPTDGEVLAVNRKVDPTTRQFEVHISVDNQTGKLFPGQFVEVELTATNSDRALVVSTECVRWIAGVPHVFEYVDGVAKRRQIELGVVIQDLAEVVSGLDANALLISSDLARLRDGLAVDLIAGRPDHED